METPFLYHGGSAQIIDCVMQEGLQPRSKTKAKDNWKHTVTSNKDAVYLTTAYPWHFAACATGPNEKGVIFEVSKELLPPWKLCPDEDFMEQASRALDPSPEQPHLAQRGWSMKKRTIHYRKIARHNPHLAKESLHYMGTCAFYGVIPVSAITRYVIIDWSKLDPSMRLRAVDSMVSCTNYRILADRHRAFVRWFFNDPVTAQELDGQFALQYPDVIVDDAVRQVLEYKAARLEYLNDVISKRNGLEIVNLKVETPA